MSLKNFSIAVGMSALGSLWVTPVRVAAQVEAAPVPPTTPVSTAPTTTYSVLLLTNGRVLKGAITEDASKTEYVLNQKGGTIRFPKRDAEAAFVSIEDLYRYKRDRIPKEDVDEQFKLARWCMEQQLTEQARAHLKAVLDVSPKYVLAQRMLANLDLTADTLAQRGATVDPAVALTGGEMPARPERASQDPRVARARNEMMRTGGIPVIFDLPPTEAVKRATEFTRAVHGVLQQNCVKCHGDNYLGEFRLIPIKTRYDLTPDVIRANLDATLPLVNREAPDSSQLLAAALVPHGGSRKPALRGPNDPAYLALAGWVARLKYVPPADPGVTTAALPGAPGAERFGGDRDPEGTPAPLPTPGASTGLIPAKPPKFTAVPDPKTGLPAAAPADDANIFQGRAVTVPKEIVSPFVAPGASFPQPYMPGSASNPGAAPKIPPGGLPATLPPMPKATPVPGAALLPKDAPEETLETTPAPAAAKKKRAKIDPAALEKLLKARQASPQP